MLYDLQAKNCNKLLKTKLVSKSLSSTCNTITAICNENSELGKDVYVGSTSKTLAQRLSSHKNNSLRIGYEENKLFTRMREVGLNNWIMRLLLTLKSTMCSRDDIRKFEKMCCEILNADLNTNSPITTAKEKRE